MPPKKKEDAKNAKETRDVGTDPPEPLEFDPFDVDGHKLIEDWNWMPPLACEALKMLKTQNTTGTPKVIKDKMIIFLIGYPSTGRISGLILTNQLSSFFQERSK